MLSSQELTDLYRAHQADRVLSVYVDADQHDPAQRDIWRLNLRHGLDAAWKQLTDASHDEREAFRAARTAIESAIDGEASAFLPGRAWVGFATDGEVIRLERVEAPMPDLVRWETGLRIAPYVRALKHARPVLAVILDRREAVLYRYQYHQLERLERLHANTFIGDLSEIEISKRATQTSGVRGKTGTDAAQSVLDNAAGKLIHRIVEELREEDAHAPLVIGGTREQIAALSRALPGDIAAQQVEDPSLHADLTPAELSERIEAAASEFSDRRQLSLLDEAVDAAGAGGNACLGHADTERALREQRVRVLLISSDLQQRDPDLADRLVTDALTDNGADVQLLVREAAERLDREGEGVGALLHYRIGGTGPEPG